MISSSDEQVVIALRVAANRIAVPPESRWVRERHSARDVWGIATLAVAMVVLIAVVSALDGEPRTVPGSMSHTVPPSETRSPYGTVTFDVSDDAPWVTARAKAAPDFVVLRPAWLPRTSDSASSCEIDVQVVGFSGADTSSEEYHVSYFDSRQNVWPRCSLMFGGHRDAGWGGDLPNYSPAPLATFVARGNVVYVRQSGPSDPVYLGWLENGAFYEVIAHGYELSDLVRAVNSLEPVRQTN